jgi:hypothetical protein
MLGAGPSRKLLVLEARALEGELGRGYCTARKRACWKEEIDAIRRA